MVGARRWVFVILPALLLLAISMWAQTGDRWGSLGVPTMDPGFGDLRLVTATADCVRADPDWGMDSPSCDPFGREWNYPSVWARSFAFLGLGVDRTNAVGGALIVMFCVACAVLAWVASRSRLGVPARLAGGLAVLSPVGWLALERGNVDLVIFVVLTAAVVLLASGHDSAAVPLLAVAASWKVFPVGAAVGVVRGLHRVVLYVVIFVVTGGFALVFELPAVIDRTLVGAYTSYGAAIVPDLGLERIGVDNELLARLIGVLCVVGVVGVLVALDRSAHARHRPTLAAVSADLDANRASWSLFLVGAGSFLVSYAMGWSWDYRMIFLIPTVFGLGAVVSPVAAAMLWSLVGVMYLSAWNRTTEVLADVVLLVLVPALVVVFCDLARVPGWRRLRQWPNPTTVVA